MVSGMEIKIMEQAGQRALSGLDDLIQDILRSGEPMSRSEIREALRRMGREVSDRAVSGVLRSLVMDGICGHAGYRRCQNVVGRDVLVPLYRKVG